MKVEASAGRILPVQGNGGAAYHAGMINPPRMRGAQGPRCRSTSLYERVPQLELLFAGQQLPGSFQR